MKRLGKVLAGLALIGIVSGCATANNRNPQDPFERFNRSMFVFNDDIDRVAVKPVATVYQKVVPNVVQTGVGNFFGNLGDVWIGVNNLLQGKFEDGLNDFMRVAVNSTFGIAGLFDVSSEAGIQKHHEDFGQTLGYWGVRSGPYVVLPFLGSSTLRDSLATPLDIAGDPWTYKQPFRLRAAGTVLRGVDLRASLLGASSLVEDAALDRYEFIRDAYLQRRQGIIDDGRNSRLKDYGVDSGDVAKPATNSEVGDKPAPNATPTPAPATAPASPPAAPPSPNGGAVPAKPSASLMDERGMALTSADNLPISVSSDEVAKQLVASAESFQK